MDIIEGNYIWKGILTRQWHPTPVLLPRKSHGRRSLVGCSPWGREESDTTERLHFHISLSCIGEGNGNLLQCSCLENPRDARVWWAAVYGVSQSWTQLKWLTSSSSSNIHIPLLELPTYSVLTNGDDEVIWWWLWASLVAQVVKNPSAMQETQVWSLGLGDRLEKGMATHSSILAWKIPQTEELGRL